MWEWRNDDWHEVDWPSKGYVAICRSKKRPKWTPGPGLTGPAPRSKRRPRQRRAPSSNGSSPTENDAPRALARPFDVRLLDARSDIEVSLTERAAQHALSTSHGLESGDVLAGVVHGHPQRVLVTDASPPGANARRSPAEYRPDSTADVFFLNRLEASLGGQVREVGGWHSHLALEDLEPSTPDLQAWCGHLALLRHAFCVSLIVAPGRGRKIKAGVFITRPDARRGGDWLTCQRCSLDVAGARTIWLS